MDTILSEPKSIVSPYITLDVTGASDIIIRVF